MGIIYQFLNNHLNATKCFKKMLQLAWVKNNFNAEMVAYDCMAIQYYYLGDLDRSDYFHNRSMKGIREKEDSRDRQHAIQTYDKKIKEL